MNDMNRRAFLRGAGFAFAGVVGAASLAGAQQEEDEEKKAAEEEKEEEELDYDALFAEDPGDEDTRACRSAVRSCTARVGPWTCENCGYSYVE